MLKSSIFRDMDKLSPRYVPKVLQHREDQMKFLSSIYERALDNIEERYLQPSQLVGLFCGCRSHRWCRSYSSFHGG